MASAAEMMSALGWQGMRNKRFTVIAILLTAATVVFAQENTASRSPGKTVAPSGNQSSASLNSTGDKRVADQDQIDSNNGTNASANDLTATSPLEGDATENVTAANAEPKANESLTATDDYRATERISEDRSVSFPVDI
jgi:hypothetical protein